MKTRILIPRILRLLETDGQLGDGAELAAAYAEAVKTANERLEAVEISISAGQVSDAIRMLEESPRLLDEIALLDFSQLPDWFAFCRGRRWALPPQIDRTQLERVFEVCNSAAAVEPILKMYRKAMRLSDLPLAVQSLRRLVEVDGERSWRAELIQAESTLLHQLIRDFKSAQAQQNDSEADHLASRVLEEKWTAPLAENWLAEVRLYREMKAAQARKREQAEDLQLLEKCLETWDFGHVKALVEHLELLVAHGTALPPESLSLFNCAKQKLQEACEEKRKEAEWKEQCEALHRAVQQEDVTAIRRGLSVPDFLDRPPPEELLIQAKRVLHVTEVNKQRGAKRIAMLILFTLLLIGSLVFYFVSESNFESACAGYAADLEEKAARGDGIVLLEQQLKLLAEHEPDVYADPRIQIFRTEVLPRLKHREAERRRLFETGLQALTALRDGGWAADPQVVEEKFREIGDTVKTQSEKRELSSLRTAYRAHCTDREAEQKQEAQASGASLLARCKTLESVAATRLFTPEEEALCARWSQDADAWLARHEMRVPTVAVALNEKKNVLSALQKTSQEVKALLEKLDTAITLDGFLETRSLLCDRFSCFEEVAVLKKLPLDPARYQDAVAGRLPQQVSLRALADTAEPMSENEFKIYLREEILPIRDADILINLYEVCEVMRDGSRKVCAYAIGEPEIKTEFTPKFQNAVVGNLLYLNENKMRAKLSDSTRKWTAKEKHCSSREFDLLIRKVTTETITPQSLEIFCYERIEQHLRAAQEDAADLRTPGVWSAYKRMQMVCIYMRILQRLGAVPTASPLGEKFAKIVKLAEPVAVDGISKALSWAAVDNSAVKRRTADCKRWLEAVKPILVEHHRHWRKSVRQLKRLMDCQAVYVGCIVGSDAGSPLPNAHSLQTADCPTRFVLREEEGALRFKLAFFRNKSGKWISRLEEGWQIGEPLFAFKSAGAYTTFLPILQAAEQNATSQLLEEIRALFCPVK